MIFRIAADAYLHRQPNLHVALLAHVHKVLIDESGRAIGVRVSHKGQAPKDIYAINEVILSAGSIASPQLLMLSGVGPGSHLLQHNVR